MRVGEFNLWLDWMGGPDIYWYTKHLHVQLGFCLWSPALLGYWERKPGGWRFGFDLWFLWFRCLKVRAGRPSELAGTKWGREGGT